MRFFFLLLSLCRPFFSADVPTRVPQTGPEEVLVISTNSAISIARDHPGDLFVLHFVPIPMNESRVGGWMITTNSVLKFSDLSMVPDGLVRLEVQTVSRGMTSEVSSAVYDVRRAPRKPRLGRIFSGTPTNQPPSPPLPPGLASLMPLPGAETNKISYQDQQLMNAYFAKTGRRSQ